uniref:Retrovirus-related Pol polyprotein from transposon TNT 1-94 n=1 Tax=Cajanus cajan TaxID=3821 RepID=A0A151SBX1_CAJCA|nr:Retrovirus-related Pol polyprotein from transposon TNT 1-94 [Cajanus cajan]
MSKDMLTHVIGCKSSFQIWDKIHEYFHAHTNAKARQLRSDLRSTTLDNGTISDYLLRIQSLVDSLTAIGDSVSSKEHLGIVLDGLPEEYESTVSLISSRFDVLSIEEVETLLLAHESRLKKFKKKNLISVNLESSSGSNTPALQPQANLAHQDSQFPSFRDGRPGARNGCGGRSNQRYGRGRGRFSSTQCQVCHRYGHIASTCYYRFDSNFVPTLPLDNSFSTSTSTTHPVFGYTTSPFQSQSAPRPASFSNGILRPRPPNPNASQAYLVSPENLHAPLLALAMSSSSPDANIWYPDFGASNHVTNVSHNIQQFTPFEGSDQIVIGNGQGLPINSSSVTHFPSPLKPHISLTLHNLLYVPTITKNLISVSQFCKDNFVFFEFHSTFCLVKSQDTNETLLFEVVGPDGLYQFPSLLLPRQPSTVTPSAHTVSSNPVSYATWHSRLRHPHNDVLKYVFKLCNFPIINKSVFDFCTSCCLGKSHKLPSQLSKTVYHTPFELIYSDLWGLAPFLSDNGYQYYVTFVDAHTRFTWIFLLKSKAHTLDVFKQFHAMVQNQFQLPVKEIQIDWGGKFRSFTSYLAQHGIHHCLICPNTHHQNGVVECKHRHIVELGLTLLAQAHFPMHFWDYAFLTSVYLINRLPSSSIQQDVPFRKLFHQLPDYSFLCIFGCSCFPCLRPYNKTKLQFRSQECVFLGYSTSHKGYKCLASSGRTFISKDVIFCESCFPYPSLFPPSTPSSPPSSIFVPLVITNPQASVTSTSPSPPLPPISPASSTPSPSSSTSLSTHVEVPAFNLYPMTTRAKAGIVKPQLQPTLLLTHFEPKSTKQALASDT